MSLITRILLVIFLLVKSLVLSQNLEKDFSYKLKNNTPNEQITEIDKQLQIHRLKNLDFYSFLIKILDEVPTDELSPEIKRIKTCALIEGCLNLGRSRKAHSHILKEIIPRYKSLNEREEALYLWYISREGTRLDQALGLALNRLKKSRQAQDILSIYEAYKGISFVYMVSSNSDSATHFAAMATAEAKRLSDKTKLIEALSYQGKVYHYFENYVEAVNKKLQAIQLATEQNENYLKANGCIDVAKISMELQNFSQATQYLERAKNYFITLKDQRGIMKVNVLEIQNALLQGKSLDIQQLKFLQDEAKNDRDDLSLSTIKVLFSLYFSEKKEYILSNNELSGALKLMKGMEEERLNYFIHKYLAANFLELNNLKSASFHLKYALPPFKTVNFLLSEAYLLRSNIAEKKSNLDSVFFYQNAYIEVAKINEKEQFSRIVGELTEGNLREEREKIIEQQQQSILKEQRENERISFQKDRQVIIGIALGVIVLMSIFVAGIRIRSQRLKQKHREAEISQKLLRAQMNPHFVFNAMSVIQSYMYANDPDKSSRFLVNFSRLMRLILENSSKEMIPLDLEYEILDKYLNTQKMRFEDRFTYTLDFDEDLLYSKALIPPMIAQPFVENAIEHGQLHTVRGGTISVTMKSAGELLDVIIADNGIGRQKSAKTKKIKSHNSMAIDITRERIDILNRKYKVKGLIDISDAEENGRGTVVRILLPLKFDIT